MLGGSWVVESRDTSRMSNNYILISHIRGLKTPLMKLQVAPRPPVAIALCSSSSRSRKRSSSSSSSSSRSSSSSSNNNRNKPFTP